MLRESSASESRASVTCRARTNRAMLVSPSTSVAPWSCGTRRAIKTFSWTSSAWECRTIAARTSWVSLATVARWSAITSVPTRASTTKPIVRRIMSPLVPRSRSSSALRAPTTRALALRRFLCRRAIRCTRICRAMPTTTGPASGATAIISTRRPSAARRTRATTVHAPVALLAPPATRARGTTTAIVTTVGRAPSTPSAPSALTAAIAAWAPAHAIHAPIPTMAIATTAVRAASSACASPAPTAPTATTAR
mmetsp:Transcript_27797/g.71225  ORF Transcript_27797/g.71225 Transcript_27797/m.71225 type:complete len:252 (+) Transcript_27797:941-1696(+)